MSAKDNNSKFQLSNRLDDSGCTPKCASHSTFGIGTFDMISCSKCKQNEEIANTKTEYVHQFSVPEIVNVSH